MKKIMKKNLLKKIIILTLSVATLVGLFSLQAASVSAAKKTDYIPKDLVNLIPLSYLEKANAILERRAKRITPEKRKAAAEAIKNRMKKIEPKK